MIADWGNAYIPRHLIPYTSIGALLATLFIGAVLLGHFYEHFQRASLVIHASSRRGGKRNRQIALFGGLALFCFFWISVARFSRDGVPEYEVLKARAGLEWEGAKVKFGQGVEEGKVRIAQGYEEGKVKVAQGYEEGKVKLAQGMEVGSEKLREAVRDPQGAYEGVRDGIKDGVKGARNGAEAQAEAFKGQAEALKDRIGGKVAETVDALKETRAEDLVGDKFPGGSEQAGFGKPAYSQPILHRSVQHSLPSH